MNKEQKILSFVYVISFFIFTTIALATLTSCDSNTEKKNIPAEAPPVPITPTRLTIIIGPASTDWANVKTYIVIDNEQKSEFLVVVKGETGITVTKVK
jgi:uncharacterized protein (UPF0333 family)